MAEKEIRLCKNIAKFSQNLPFQLAKFCILDAKFDFSFYKKTAGTGKCTWRKMHHVQIIYMCKILVRDLWS